MKNRRKGPRNHDLAVGDRIETNVGQYIGRIVRIQGDAVLVEYAFGEPRWLKRHELAFVPTPEMIAVLKAKIRAKNDAKLFASNPTPC
jgi:hypothetical protein